MIRDKIAKIIPEACDPCRLCEKFLANSSNFCSYKEETGDINACLRYYQIARKILKLILEEAEKELTILSEDELLDYFVRSNKHICSLKESGELRLQFQYQHNLNQLKELLE